MAYPESLVITRLISLDTARKLGLVSKQKLKNPPESPVILLGAVILEVSKGARRAGKPIESPVMLLGAETLESQQKAQRCCWKQ